MESLRKRSIIEFVLGIIRSAFFLGMGIAMLCVTKRMDVYIDKLFQFFYEPFSDPGSGYLKLGAFFTGSFGVFASSLLALLGGGFVLFGAIQIFNICMSKIFAFRNLVVYTIFSILYLLFGGICTIGNIRYVWGATDISLYILPVVNLIVYATVFVLKVLFIKQRRTPDLSDRNEKRREVKW